MIFIIQKAKVEPALMHGSSHTQYRPPKYLIGTLFEEEELNKKTTYGTMKAKDPFGNTRWKGAFTGGFEAGYRNTCSSKDGWTPSSFVSSVYKRAEKKEQKIFDYMDKEDMGRENIANNISLNPGFSGPATQEDGVFKIKEMSVGEEILNRLRRQQAASNAPENAQELQQLLNRYQQQEDLQGSNLHHSVFKQLKQANEKYSSAHASEQIPPDEFIEAYHDLFKAIIRASQDEPETEEEISRKREENKVYFDFTKPLDQEPEYLREIQDVEAASKPRKRRSNVLNQLHLVNLFTAATAVLQNHQNQKAQLEELLVAVPKDYDPYHRIKGLREKEKELLEKAKVKEQDPSKKHRIFSVSSRSQVLGERNLASKFSKPSETYMTSKFVRAGQEESAKSLQKDKAFEDVSKNERYQDFVLEAQGKKISAQMHFEGRDYEEFEKEKQQFEAMYKQSTAPREKTLPRKVEQALSRNKSPNCFTTARKTGAWRPERLLCKRFNVMMPYKVESQKPVASFF